MLHNSCLDAVNSLTKEFSSLLCSSGFSGGFALNSINPFLKANNNFSSDDSCFVEDIAYLFSVGNSYNYCVGNEKMNKWRLRLSALF